MASHYYDTYSQKTRCGRCDSASWCSLGRCEDCKTACCDACATVIETPGTRPNELLCSKCALQRVREAVGEEVEGVTADPGMAAYKLVPPMQGHLFPEADTRKPMQVEVSKASQGAA